MRKGMTLVAAVVAAGLLCLAAVAHAEQPVFVDKDKLYTSLNMGFNFSTKSYFDGSRDVVRDPLGRHYTEQFYELGLIFGFKDTFDFLMNLPLHHYRLETGTGDMKDPSAVLGDRSWTRLDYVGIGFRWQVPTTKWFHSALEATLQIPTGSRVDPEPQFNGDGRLGATLRYLARKDISKMFFAQAELGVLFLDERPQNRLTYGAGGGAKLHKLANVGLNLQGISAFSAEANENPFMGLPKEQGWLWLKPFVYANPIEKLEVRVAFDYMLTGRNAYLQNGCELSIAYLWF